MTAAIWLLPERQCHTCTAVTKKRWGCEEDAPEHERLEMDGEVLARCPRRPMLDDPAYYNELFAAYGRYNQHGLLPEDGGIMSQPAKLTRAFGIIREVSDECRRTLDERNRPPKTGGTAPTARSRGRRL